MVKMEADQLREYCESVQQLEVSVYTLALAKESSNKEMVLNKPKKLNFPVPELVRPSLPQRPSEPRPLSSTSHRGFIITIVAPLFLIILAIICFSSDMPGVAVFCLILALLLLGITFVVYSAIKDERSSESKRFEEENRKYNQDMKKYIEELSTIADREKTSEQLYAQQLETYGRNIAEETERFDASMRAYESLAKEVEQEISKSLEETKDLLSTLYDKNIIFPKYRSLVAMSSIAEYLISGRCDQLEGMGGAYNLYEEEIRLNLIITQLNKVVESLEQIKNCQFLLYTQLTIANEQLSSIARDVQSTLDEVKEIKADSDKILSFSAMTAYCSRITAENAAIISRFAIVHSLEN